MATLPGGSSTRLNTLFTGVVCRLRERDGFRPRSAATFYPRLLAWLLSFHRPRVFWWIRPYCRIWWCLVSVTPNPVDNVFAWMILLVTGSLSWGISKNITQMTLARKKQVPRPSEPCLSARTVSSYVIDPMGRDSAWLGRACPGSEGLVERGPCSVRSRPPLSPFPAPRGALLGTWPCVGLKVRGLRPRCGLFGG